MVDDLNKNQIILLTVLISFVTSIATGIITSTLLQQAPVEVTRNINRIVEKTIETVTPATPTSVAVQKEVTTVVVKEEDKIIDSINKNIKSIVRIKERNPFTDETSFYGIGIVVGKDGSIATDRKSVTNAHIYTGTLSDGKIITLVPEAVDKQTNFILFKISPNEKYDGAFSPATLSDVEPKLGQTLISLGGDVSNTVSVGRAVSFDMRESYIASTTVKYLAGINTDVSAKDLVVGSPVFNLSGDIIGMRLSDDAQRSFTPISVFKKELPNITDSSKNQ